MASGTRGGDRRPEAEGVRDDAVTGPAVDTGSATSLNASARTVARNTVSGYVTLALGAGLGLVTTPILLGQLGPEGFGTWSLILGTVAYLSLLEVGLGLATITRVAAVESDGPAAVGRVLSTSLGLLSIVGFVGLVAACVLYAVFPLLYDIPSGIVPETRAAVLLVALWQCLTLIASVYSAGLLGTGRMHVVNLQGFAVSALVTIAQAVILLAGGGLVEIAIATAIGGVATVAGFAWQLRRLLPGVSVSWRFVDRTVARRLVALGWRNSVTSVASAVAFGSDIVLVGLLLGPRSAAAYAIALRGYTLLQRVATGVASALGPSHAHAAVHGTPERRFEMYCLGLAVSLAFALLGGLGVGIFAGPLLQLWLGPFPGDATAILVVLCAVLVLQMPGHHAASVLLNSEKAGVLMRITVTAAAINVAASVFFTVTIGTIGPALGTLTAVLLVDVFYLPWRLCTMLGRSFGELVRRVFVPLVAPSLLLIAMLALGRLAVPDGAGVLVVVGLAGMAFLGALVPTAAGRDVRRLVRASARPGGAAQA